MRRGTLSSGSPRPPPFQRPAHLELPAIVPSAPGREYRPRPGASGHRSINEQARFQHGDGQEFAMHTPHQRWLDPPASLQYPARERGHPPLAAHPRTVSGGRERAKSRRHSVASPAPGNPVCGQTTPPPGWLLPPGWSEMRPPGRETPRLPGVSIFLPSDRADLAEARPPGWQHPTPPPHCARTLTGSQSSLPGQKQCQSPPGWHCSPPSRHKSPGADLPQPSPGGFRRFLTARLFAPPRCPDTHRATQPCTEFANLKTPRGIGG